MGVGGYEEGSGEGAETLRGTNPLLVNENVSRVVLRRAWTVAVAMTVAQLVSIMQCPQRTGHSRAHGQYLRSTLGIVPRP